VPCRDSSNQAGGLWTNNLYFRNYIGYKEAQETRGLSSVQTPKKYKCPSDQQKAWLHAYDVESGSTTGTLLNERILVGSQLLFDNDEIRIGPYLLRIEIRRKEKRGGIILALLALLLALFFIAAAFSSGFRMQITSQQQGKKSENETATRTLWQEWEVLLQWALRRVLQ